MRPLMTIEQLAEVLQIPIDTIYVWRAKKYGPPAIKVGKYLRWKPEDVQAWIDQQEAG